MQEVRASQAEGSIVIRTSDTKKQNSAAKPISKQT